MFAWDLSQIHGISRDIIEHKLSTNPVEKPVKQRLRTLGAERKKAAETEVKKHLHTGFIREVKHPRWLSNIVKVKKSTGG